MSSLQTKPAVAQSAATIAVAVSASSSSNLRNLKGSMTLPLQSSVNVGNNVTHMRGMTPLAQLNSPDLMKNLGLTSTGVTPFLTSPDFEKLVSQSLTVGITPTSGGGNAPQTPTTFLNPKFVTEEQERFVMNFDEKIKSMIKKEREAGVDENQLNTPVIMDISGSYVGGTSTSSTAVVTAAGQSIMATSHSQQQQEQQAAIFSTAAPTDVSAAPAMSSAAAVAAAAVSANLRAQLQSYTDSDDPMDDVSCSSRQVDMTEQEHMKLERKRQRNRDAARKCRERKLERIRFLEERVSELKSQNGRLQRTAVDLREQVKTLQHVIVEHTKRGCSLKDSLSAKLGLA